MTATNETDLAAAVAAGTAAGAAAGTTATQASTKHDSDIGVEEAWSANIKRTYDEFQHESLESVRRNRSYIDKILSDAQQYDNGRQNMANQALQNAVETANMVGKQVMRHSDLAIDRQWNVDEVSALTAKSGVEADALISAMAVAIAKAMKDG